MEGEKGSITMKGGKLEKGQSFHSYTLLGISQPKSHVGFSLSEGEKGERRK